jgi:hypothetical protein
MKKLRFGVYGSKNEVKLTETIVEINGLRGFDRLTPRNSRNGKKSFVIFGSSWFAGVSAFFMRFFLFLFF